MLKIIRFGLLEARIHKVGRKMQENKKQKIKMKK